MISPTKSSAHNTLSKLVFHCIFDMSLMRKIFFMMMIMLSDDCARSDNIGLLISDATIHATI